MGIIRESFEWATNAVIENWNKRAALNEADALRAVLIECRDKWDSADNGRCTSCDFGYRKFDTKSNVQECDNAECLSHRIRAAIKPKEDK